MRPSLNLKEWGHITPNDEQFQIEKQALALRSGRCCQENTHPAIRVLQFLEDGSSFLVECGRIFFRCPPHFSGGIAA
ncbi:MAG TPA: hypothetical protein DD706_15155 [Nitrospiraceae bacterium]|nr:hypothetical protein [Nitrospiraceae bacterium]